MKLKCNCCDGIYNSFDVHFTSACDNKCAHCVDQCYEGTHIVKPDVEAIANTILANKEVLDDVLFLGGEPCLFLEELIQCVDILRASSNLKLYVTTSVPKICYDRRDLFEELIEKLDGLNISAQSHDEKVADEIRKTKSKYDRQAFYNSLPHKEKNKNQSKHSKAVSVYQGRFNSVSKTLRQYGLQLNQAFRNTARSRILCII